MTKKPKKNKKGDDDYYSNLIIQRIDNQIEKRFAELSETSLRFGEPGEKGSIGKEKAASKMSVDAWFHQWISILEGVRKRKTIINYTNYYNIYIKPVIGDMAISDVKPMHCNLVLQEMTKNYKVSSIKQTRVAMSCMFQYAVDNDIIIKNPVGKTVAIPSDMLNDDERHLLISEEDLNKFFDVARGTMYYLPFRLVLETGLRASELIGLTWDEVDLENGYIHIRHTMQYDKKHGWYFSTPKSKTGVRDIYMTSQCQEILKEAYARYKLRDLGDNSDYKELVFVSLHKTPIRNNTYDAAIRAICKKAGIEEFSIHSLRHTFASRCMAAGISAKVLQSVMGHSDISTTMNIYVHINEAIKEEEMKKLNTYTQ